MQENQMKKYKQRTLYINIYIYIYVHTHSGLCKYNSNSWWNK